MKLLMIVCASLPSIVAAAAAGSEPPPANYSASQLQVRLVELNNQIQSFNIIYDSIPQKGAWGTDYLHRQLAASSPDRLMSWSAKATDEYTPEQDPLQQRLIVSADTATIDYPADRAFAISHLDGALPSSTSREILFIALGWWPLKSRTLPQSIPGTAIVLPDIARSRAYRVWPQQVLQGGQWCHVLEHDGHDRLWLDTARGCSIMARELIDIDSGNVAQRIEASDQSQIAPGIWIPMRFRNQIFVAAEHRLKLDAELLVREAHINDARTSALFDFQPKPGSIQLSSGNFVQVMPGGLDHLDETAQRLKRFNRYTDLGVESRQWSLVTIAAIGVLIFLVAPAVAKRTKLRSAA